MCYKYFQLVIIFSIFSEIIAKASPIMVWYASVKHYLNSFKIRYWRDKYIHVEELLKQYMRQAKTHKDKLYDLTWRTNETVRTIDLLAQTQMRINESDLRDIQGNTSDVQVITQQSDLNRAAQRPVRISSASSSSHHPASSHESSDLSASSTSSTSTDSDSGTPPQGDHAGFPTTSNHSGLESMNQSYCKSFHGLVSDRSDHDSDGAQAVDAIPATVNDDNDNDDDRASIRTITKSVSQHSLTFHQLRPSHRDNPESHKQVEEPEDLREFRETHYKITKKYRQPK